MRTIFFSLTVLLSACATFTPWNKPVSMPIWTAPGQHALFWHKEWHCWSETGLCYEDRITDADGKSIEFDDHAVEAYLEVHLADDLRFWSFVGSLFSVKHPDLDATIRQWQQHPRATPLPVRCYRISHHPTVVLVIEDQNPESAWINHAFSSEYVGFDDLRRLYDQHRDDVAPPHLVRPVRIEPASMIKLNDIVESRVLRDGKKYDGQSLPSERLSTVRVAQIDRPDEPLITIDPKAGPTRIALSAGDTLSISWDGVSLNFERTAQ